MDPCLLVRVLYLQVSDLDSELAQALSQGGKAREDLFAAWQRSQRKIVNVHFHESYHFWQGLALPWMLRYATLSFREVALKYREVLSLIPGTTPAHLEELDACGIIAPEFHFLEVSFPVRASFDRRMAGPVVNEDDQASEAPDLFESRVSLLDLLETAASLAEYQTLSKVPVKNLWSYATFERWRKRTPSCSVGVTLAKWLIGDGDIAIRATLPAINVAFTCSRPLRMYVQLLGALRHLVQAKFRPVMDFLAQSEPCHWRALFVKLRDDILRQDKAQAGEPSRISLVETEQFLIDRQAWATGSFSGGSGTLGRHPVVGDLAERWLDMESKSPAMAWALDCPAYVSSNTWETLSEEFTPPVTFVSVTGSDGKRSAFAAMTKDIAAEERAGYLQFSTRAFSVVRRVTGAMYQEGHRMCGHSECTYYKLNFCNSQIPIPTDYTRCSFPDDIESDRQTLAEIKR